MSHKKPTQHIPSSGHSSKGESVFLDQWVSRAHTHIHQLPVKTCNLKGNRSLYNIDILPCLRMFLIQDSYCVNFPFIPVELVNSVHLLLDWNCFDWTVNHLPFSMMKEHFLIFLCSCWQHLCISEYVSDIMLESMLWFPPKTIIKESFSFSPWLFCQPSKTATGEVREIFPFSFASIFVFMRVISVKVESLSIMMADWGYLVRSWAYQS